MFRLVLSFVLTLLCIFVDLGVYVRRLLIVAAIPYVR